jgi:hypothetical protein
MRTALHARVSLALLAILVTPALAENKIDGLIFRPTQTFGLNCPNGPFWVSQEPSPFFKQVTRTKTHGVEQVHRGQEVIEQFPDELTVIVESWPSSEPLQTSMPGVCPINFGIDPLTIKFRAEWRAAGTTTIAKGIVVQSKLLDPGPWCEDNCEGSWEYELRIDSQGVPLRDTLVISVDANDGTHLAEYIGALGSATEKVTHAPLP